MNLGVLVGSPIGPGEVSSFLAGERTMNKAGSGGLGSLIILSPANPSSPTTPLGRLAMIREC